MAKYVERTYDGRDGLPAIKVASMAFQEIPYSALQKALRKKDITRNGSRVDEKAKFQHQDRIGLFYNYIPDIRYEDDNIVVLYKPKGIASVGDFSFAYLISNWVNAAYQPMHRLDTNTDGLIIFAKTKTAFDEMLALMKQEGVEKHYLARVIGDANDIIGEQSAYLFKDARVGKSFITKHHVDGSFPIKMTVSVLYSSSEQSYVELEIVSGKMHQLRAHLAELGHYILGDSKYGRGDVSERMGYDKQQLTAYKLVFHCRSGYYSYLDGVSVT